MAEKEKTSESVSEIYIDPMLNKFFDKLDDIRYRIPEDDYINLIKNTKGIKSTEPGRLIHRATSPEDYQMQLSMLSQIQSFQDQVHEMVINLRILRHNWTILYNLAQDYLIKKYSAKLLELKHETTKKSVLVAALRPIQTGIDTIHMLQGLSDDTMKHLDRSDWNIKEANVLVVEYLKPLRYPTKASV